MRRKNLMNKRKWFDDIGNALLDIAILMLLMFAIFIWIVDYKIESKVMMWVYLGAVAWFIWDTRKTVTAVFPSFKQDTKKSFIGWVFVVPIICGMILGCLVVAQTDIGNPIRTCEIVMIIAHIVASLVWFVCKLCQENCRMSVLDLYSSIVIAVLTALSLAIDYSEIKGWFVGVFIYYLVLQILIKRKSCEKEQ